MGAPTPPDVLLQGISSPTKRREAALSRRFSFLWRKTGVPETLWWDAGEALKRIVCCRPSWAEFEEYAPRGRVTRTPP